MALRVAFLTVDFSSRTSGGIGSYIHTLATALADRGHEVIVLSPLISARDGAHYKTRTTDGNVPLSRRRLELSQRFREALRQLSRQSAVDLVEATDWGMEGFAFQTEQDPPVVVRAHTPNSVVNELNGYSRLRDSGAVDDAEGEYFGRARYLSAPSRAMERLLTSRYAIRKEAVTLIPNPIDVRQCRALAVPEEEREDHRIGFLGRLEPRKGVYVLARALQNLFGKEPHVEVDLIGPDTRLRTGSVGRDLREMLSLWESRVRFWGHLAGDRRIEVLRRCGCVVLPSLWENFPYACLEAMALGKPVIATTGSGFEEIMEPDRHGLLVPPNDSAALAEALRRAVHGGLGGMGPQAAERVEEFDVSRIVSRIEQYYLGIVRDKP